MSGHSNAYKNNNPIKKINQRSVTSIVYNDLKKRIVSGDFNAGDKLPSEQNLAEMYGVSRATIRTAMQNLKNYGIIDIKMGEGSYVKEWDFLDIVSGVSELVAQDSMLGYLEEFRVYIEKACVELAVKNATKEELHKLKEYALQLEVDAKNRDVESFTKHDFVFHYTLTVASHNKIFELVYSSIKDIFYKCISTNLKEIQESDLGYLELSASWHIELVEHICAKRTKSAVESIERIVSRFDAHDHLHNKKNDQI